MDYLLQIVSMIMFDNQIAWESLKEQIKQRTHRGRVKISEGKSGIEESLPPRTSLTININNW
jgi:hypothetical protein